MKIIKTIEEMHKLKNELQMKNQSLGFVPTMGYLHDGHRKLIKEAKSLNEKVIVSIFVNPLQFNQSSDFDNYPSDVERDENILKDDGVDFLFYPSADEMYPGPLAIQMNVVRRTDSLCGVSRPGHFEGVVTVLTKLFNIIQPNDVYFGVKDAQQVAVVDALIEDFNFDINLYPVPTVRETDGLAMSSRNVNLEPKEREEAKYIYQALLYGQQYIQSHKWTRTDVIHEVKEFLNANITGDIDYIDCLSFPELNDEISENHDIIIAVAVYYKKARLIDNIILNHQGRIKFGSE
ncbi:pantoate--beta-alanine ligase [Filobacillus milosensis]|uniref:Pantothenate synthetase n=1 Tax=Filobacillus milosensis TaxID=94137 RepID=A0A4Y8IR03_9BACI|nr:pantoate--beta-alanine ligase [Filobacillus milosensis]TFB23986.1 pantoate--beta-alanine ligase [Filobacillus milosensis]